LRTNCLGWPRTTILLISASHVAKIRGMSLHTGPEIGLELVVHPTSLPPVYCSDLPEQDKTAAFLS
jgi:hypothetical protein